MTRPSIWGRLCGAADPETGTLCLLADGHYQLRRTMHRGIATRQGIRRWGPGLVNMHDRDPAPPSTENTPPPRANQT